MADIDDLLNRAKRGAAQAAESSGKGSGQSASSKPDGEGVVASVQDTLKTVRQFNENITWQRNMVEKTTGFVKGAFNKAAQCKPLVISGKILWNSVGLPLKYVAWPAAKKGYAGYRKLFHWAAQPVAREELGFKSDWLKFTKPVFDKIHPHVPAIKTGTAVAAVLAPVLLAADLAFGAPTTRLAAEAGWDVVMSTTEKTENFILIGPDPVNDDDSVYSISAAREFPAAPEDTIHFRVSRDFWYMISAPDAESMYDAVPVNESLGTIKYTGQRHKYLFGLINVYPQVKGLSKMTPLTQLPAGHPARMKFETGEIIKAADYPLLPIGNEARAREKLTPAP